MKKQITYNTLKSLEKNGTLLLTTEEEFLNAKVNKTQSLNQIPFKWQCDCGEVFNRNICTQRKSELGKCKKCTSEVKARKKRLPDKRYHDLIQSKGVTLIGDLPKSTEDSFTVACECGKEMVTSYASMRNTNAKDGKLKCRECRASENARLYMKPYSMVKEASLIKKVVLLTTEEEYLKNNNSLKIIGACGHETTIHTRTLFREEAHCLCKECTKKLTSGENNYNWKGGTYEDEHIRFRKTYEFKSWVKAVYKRDNYTCQCCGQKHGKLNSHHLDGYNWCIEKRTDVNNGITLCESCHVDFHKNFGYGDNTKEQFEEYLLSLQQIAS